MPIVPINYLAVLVAAIVQMVLGFLWYGPIFGKPWGKLMGWSPETMEAMKKDPKMKKTMMRNYLIMAVGSLLMAWILDHAIIFASAYLLFSGVTAAVAVGFMNWLGFFAPVTVGPVLWEGKSWKLWFLNSGYYLVGLILMGIVLALWH